MLLKNLREGSNISQTELAEVSGLSRKKLYNIERNLVEIKPEDLERLSSAIAERIDLSYVAGLFDRASSITITRIPSGKIHKNQKSPSYISRISFHTKYKVLADIIQKVFNTGAVTELNTGGYHFYAHCESVDTIIEKLLPYIKLKRQKFIVLKEFREFLEKSRDDYRKNIGSYRYKIKQDYNSSVWWTLAEAASRIDCNKESLRLLLTHKKLIGRKEVERNQEVWKVAPITNLQDLSNHKRLPLDQKIIDRYEYFYNKIRAV